MQYSRSDRSSKRISLRKAPDADGHASKRPYATWYDSRGNDATQWIVKRRELKVPNSITL